MNDQPAFTAKVYQNQYLPVGGTVVDAVVTVTASGSGLAAVGTPPTAAQVIMIDCSGSMNAPVTKIAEAKKATMTAIDMLTDGKNQHETAEQLAMVLRACEGRFLCDTRGVGEDWSGSELRTVASALLG